MTKYKISERDLGKLEIVSGWIDIPEKYEVISNIVKRVRKQKIK